MPKLSIGEFLLREKVLTQGQLENALILQKENNEKLDKVLLRTGYLDHKTFLEYLAKYLNIPLIDLTQYVSKSNVTIKLPESYARRFQAIILEEESNGSLLIGMTDPSDIFSVDELSRVLGKPLKFALVDEKELNHKLDLIYRRTEEITNFAQKLDRELKEATDINIDEEKKKQADYVVEKLLESLFADALQVGASDIHIEPSENFLRVRLRVDGLLQEQIIATQEKNIASALSQRLKLMAGLNIAEKRLPQDGGFDVVIRNSPLDVRLSTMPTIFGETIVMRLLHRSGKLLDLNKIGMSPKMLERFRELIKSPHGIILVTGPTGSGKTTTLYGALSEINEVAKNIVTVEDPVEYRIDRLNQVQVNPQIDLSFARVLKSILRQDPNIILIGEIRDKDTASIALRAALTGQLVFATLHTNDAASTAIRLLDIGVESYLVAATVRAVLSQRLVRRICEYCAAPYEPSIHEQMLIKSLLGNDHSKKEFYRGKGCAHCNNSGYQGRVGVFELLEFSRDMLEALRRNDTNEFLRLAYSNRTSPTLISNVIELATQGATTVSEVLRLAGE